MRPILAACLVAAFVATGGPARAVDVPGGCVAANPAGNGATCSYIAAGPGVFLAAAQMYEIRVLRNNTIVWSTFHGLLDPPAPHGAFPSIAGDKVEVAVGGLTVQPPSLPSIDTAPGIVAAHDA